jgi:hypothetical protein
LVCLLLFLYFLFILVCGCGDDLLHHPGKEDDGEAGDGSARPSQNNDTNAIVHRRSFLSTCWHSFTHSCSNFGYRHYGSFNDIDIIALHPSTKEDPTAPGQVGTEDLRLSSDIYNKELTFSIIIKNPQTLTGFITLDIECFTDEDYFLLIRGFKYLLEEKLDEKKRQREALGEDGNKNSPNGTSLWKKTHSNLSSFYQNAKDVVFQNKNEQDQKNPAEELFAPSFIIDPLRAMRVGGGLLPKGGGLMASPPLFPSKNQNNDGNKNNNMTDMDDILLNNNNNTNNNRPNTLRLPLAQFLGWKSAGTQIWARLKMAGLDVKVVFSYDLTRIILKLRCPKWRLEQMAEQMHLKLKTKNGLLKPFRVSKRDSFIPYGAEGNIFRSSERQQIIDYILRSRIMDGGAELDSSTDLGKFIIQRFPLHMYARLHDIRHSWVTFWKKEKYGETSAAWSPFTVSYFVTLNKTLDSVHHFFNNLLSQPLDNIAEYYGESIAFYFAFLAFYTRWLIFPSILGVILFIIQVNSHTLDHWLCIPYAVLIMVWICFLLVFWKQKASTLAYKWGVLDYEVNETERPEFIGEEVIDDLTGEIRKIYPYHKRFLRYLFTTPIWAGIIILTLIIQTTVFYSQDILYSEYEHSEKLTYAPSFPPIFSQHRHLSSTSSTPSTSKSNLTWNTLTDSNFWAVTFFYPSLYGVIVNLISIFFHFIAKMLNEVENYSTQTVFMNRLILKVFSFEFVSIFTSLYYYAFFTNNNADSSYLRISVTILALMTVGQWWKILLDICIPSLYHRFLLYRMKSNVSMINRKIYRVKEWTEQQKQNLQGVGSSNSEEADDNDSLDLEAPGKEYKHLSEVQRKLHKRMALLQQSKSKCWEEALQLHYNTFSDYTLLIIQVCFLLTFGSIFPLIPLIALINNLILIRMNAFKICYTRQRPISQKIGGIGVWSDVLQIFSIGGVLTNCALIGFVSQPFRSFFIPLIGETGIALLLFGYEQVLLLFKYWLHTSIPTIPFSVQRALLRERKSISKKSLLMQQQLLRKKHQEIIHHKKEKEKKQKLLREQQNMGGKQNSILQQFVRRVSSLIHHNHHHNNNITPGGDSGVVMEGIGSDSFTSPVANHENSFVDGEEKADIEMVPAFKESISNICEQEIPFQRSKSYDEEEDDDINYQQQEQRDHDDYDYEEEEEENENYNEDGDQYDDENDEDTVIIEERHQYHNHQKKQRASHLPPRDSIYSPPSEDYISSEEEEDEEEHGDYYDEEELDELPPPDESFEEGEEDDSDYRSPPPYQPHQQDEEDAMSMFSPNMRVDEKSLQKKYSKFLSSRSYDSHDHHYYQQHQQIPLLASQSHSPLDPRLVPTRKSSINFGKRRSSAQPRGRFSILSYDEDNIEDDDDPEEFSLLSPIEERNFVHFQDYLPTDKSMHHPTPQNRISKKVKPYLNPEEANYLRELQQQHYHERQQSINKHVQKDLWNMRFSLLDEPVEEHEYRKHKESLSPNSRRKSSLSPKRLSVSPKTRQSISPNMKRTSLSPTKSPNQNKHSPGGGRPSILKIKKVSPGGHHYTNSPSGASSRKSAVSGMLIHSSQPQSFQQKKFHRNEALLKQILIQQQQILQLDSMAKKKKSIARQSMMEASQSVSMNTQKSRNLKRNSSLGITAKRNPSQSQQQEIAKRVPKQTRAVPELKTQYSVVQMVPFHENGSHHPQKKTSTPTGASLPRPSHVHSSNNNNSGGYSKRPLASTASPIAMMNTRSPPPGSRSHQKLGNSPSAQRLEKKLQQIEAHQLLSSPQSPSYNNYYNNGGHSGRTPNSATAHSASKSVLQRSNHSTRHLFPPEHTASPFSSILETIIPHSNNSKLQCQIPVHSSSMENSDNENSPLMANRPVSAHSPKGRREEEGNNGSKRSPKSSVAHPESFPRQQYSPLRARQQLQQEEQDSPSKLSPDKRSSGFGPLPNLPPSSSSPPRPSNNNRNPLTTDPSQKGIELTSFSPPRERRPSLSPQRTANGGRRSLSPKHQPQQEITFAEPQYTPSSKTGGGDAASGKKKKAYHQRHLLQPLSSDDTLERIEEDQEKNERKAGVGGLLSMPYNPFNFIRFPSSPSKTNRTQQHNNNDQQNISGSYSKSHSKPSRIDFE